MRAVSSRDILHATRFTHPISEQAFDAVAALGAMTISYASHRQVWAQAGLVIGVGAK
jgi:hypothetical protein